MDRDIVGWCVAESTTIRGDEGSQRRRGGEGVGGLYMIDLILLMKLDMTLFLHEFFLTDEIEINDNEQRQR